MNEDETSTINMKGCTLMIDCRGYKSKRGKRQKEKERKEKERKNMKEKVFMEGFEPVTFCL